MVRYLFPPDLVVTNVAGDARIGAAAAFTVWTERIGGSDVSSQMRAPDGVTVVALVADSNGLRPVLSGPDGYKTLWCDTGVGLRFPMYAYDALAATLAGGGGGGGVTAHSGLSGLAADDHTQYHTDARGDARYYVRTTVDSMVNAAATAQSPNDRARTNHTGTQAIGTVELLQAALDARVRFILVSTGSESRGGTGGLVIWVCPTGVTPANAATSDLIVTTTTGTAPSDTVAPSAPSNVVVSGINSAGFTVSWTAATDNVGVTAYRVLLNGTARPLVTGTTQSFTDLAASTTYTVAVQARDAAGNWGPTAAPSPSSVTTSASGGTTERNVFGASPHPGTLAKSVETPITVATAFYTFSSQANGWRSVGGRLYVPAGVSVPSSCQLSMWLGNPPDLSTTPTRTATMSGITAGQWNEARWSSPYTLTPGTPFWIGYKFSDGTYLAVASQASGAIKSNNTDFLYEAASDEFSNSRSRYRYDTGTAGGGSTHWGIDAIVDQGAG